MVYIVVRQKHALCSKKKLLGSQNSDVQVVLEHLEQPSFDARMKQEASSTDTV